MPKKRRKSKSPKRGEPIKRPKNTTIQRKKYIKILEKVCIHSGCEDAFKMLSKDEKLRIFACRAVVEPLSIDNTHKLAKGAAYFFKKQMKFFYSSPNGGMARHSRIDLSNYEILIGVQFLDVIDRLEGERKIQLQIAFAPMLEYLGNVYDFAENVVRFYTVTANSTNIFNDTIHILKLHFKMQNYPAPVLCYKSTLQAVPCRESSFVENGNFRKVYQLGYLMNDSHLEWAFVHVNKLSGLYKGKKLHLPICIQNHAYNRLIERLEPIIDMDVIWHLTNTLKRLDKIEIYNGRILIPFFYFNHKCGYFVCIINLNRLIIKTFLFLTNHCTPEGEKLEEILGISKEEIDYWKIGSLKNFMNSNLDSNHQMMEAFKDAGISHLFDLDPLLDKNEQRNNYDWDALNVYINRGKSELYDEGAIEEVAEVQEDCYNESSFELEMQ